MPWVLKKNVYSNDLGSLCQDMSDLHIYQLNYGIEYLGLGKVIWYQNIKYADSKSTAYLCGTWLKTKTYQTVIFAYLWYVSTRIIAPCP